MTTIRTRARAAMTSAAAVVLLGMALPGAAYAGPAQDPASDQQAPVFSVVQHPHTGVIRDFPACC